MKTNSIKLIAVALAMALLVGCTQNQILASLEASVAATEVLVATLQMMGKISPKTADQIELAIAGLPAAYRETAAELASSDDAAAKVAKVAGYYSATLAALQALPPDAQIYAVAISESIQALLSGLRPAQGARPMVAVAEPVKFDARRLNSIASRAFKLELQLAELGAASASKAEKGTR